MRSEGTNDRKKSKFQRESQEEAGVAVIRGSIVEPLRDDAITSYLPGGTPPPPEGHLGTFQWQSVCPLPPVAHQPRTDVPGDAHGDLYSRARAWSESSTHLGQKRLHSLSHQALTLKVTSPLPEASLRFPVGPPAL